MPSVFFAYSYVLPNGFCGLMSNPLLRTCTPRLFYSNPLKEFEGHKTGAGDANNALWITSNRFALARMGDEQKTCKGKIKYYPKFFTMMETSEWNSWNSFTHLFPRFHRWSG